MLPKSDGVLMLKWAGMMPVPCMNEVALPPGLAAAVRVASPKPVKKGSKATVTVQEAPAARPDVQVVDRMLNSKESGPPRLAVTVPDGDWPVLVTTNDSPADRGPSGTCPKSTQDGLRDRLAGARPSPCSAAAAVPPGVAVAVRLAVIVPTDPAVKCTATVHVPPPGRASPQVLLSMTKSAASEPFSVTVTGPEVPWPVLVTVNDCWLEDAPAAVGPKSNVAGVIDSAAGVMPVPCNA